MDFLTSKAAHHAGRFTTASSGTSSDRRSSLQALRQSPWTSCLRGTVTVRLASHQPESHTQGRQLFANKPVMSGV